MSKLYLKPCPFCGGNAEIMKMGFPHWVFCTKCGAKVHGGVVGEKERESASAIAWNRRVQTPEIGIYDKEETIENCTVQVLENTVTGAVSVGWWRNE